MSTIKIEITVDAQDGVIIDALKGLLLAQKGLVENTEVVDAEEVKTPPVKKSAPKATAKKAPEPDPEEDDEDIDPLADDDAEEHVTLEDLKALLAKKVTIHRDAIVKKLKALGAPKISELEESDYRDMHTFLSKLK